MTRTGCSRGRFIVRTLFVSSVFLSTNLLGQNGLFEVPSENEGYPNPSNPSTVMAYAVPEGGSVELVVIDVWGREVAHLVNGYRNAGDHNVVFDASHSPSGVYLYRL